MRPRPDASSPGVSAGRCIRSAVGFPRLAAFEASRNRRMASLSEMRDGNRIGLLQTLRRVGEADRAELARLTGLSRATISGLLSEAIARGHVVERSPGGAVTSGRRGRPAMLRLDPRAGVVAGVDLGHGRLRVVLADLEASAVGERVVAVDVDAPPDVALDAAA